MYKCFNIHLLLVEASVRLSTVSGTAADADYAPKIDQVVTFLVGESNKTVTLSTLTDEVRTVCLK